MLQQILYCHIPVKSLKHSIQWYSDVLKLSFVWHSEEELQAQLNLPSGQMLFLVETGVTTRATFMKKDEEQAIVAFQTKDIDQLHQHLLEHQVKVETITNDGLGNSFLDFYDPDGNKFNVQCDVDEASS
ncbi:VOC family protein [Alkalicoccobacillus porphyridii]|uniref:VOC family protein n=1 Tax=Alkalicoccobacillus porphyridii TaxID=2597270 RepID=A0A554A1Y3_9BACI|nr:VOC family protein [Alkalicoccobacillus porphyridii]TSB47702.1 VOC family protein [Alkalicoccobacillus porphyridii]